jgi:hypothetical protein
MTALAPVMSGRDWLLVRFGYGAGAHTRRFATACARDVVPARKPAPRAVRPAGNSPYEASASVPSGRRTGINCTSTMPGASASGKSSFPAIPWSRLPRPDGEYVYAYIVSLRQEAGAFPSQVSVQSPMRFFDIDITGVSTRAWWNRKRRQWFSLSPPIRQAYIIVGTLSPSQCRLP